MHTSTSHPVPQILRIKQVAAILNIGRSTVYRLVKQAVLPAPIKIGATTGWLDSDITAFITSRKQAVQP